MPRAKRTTETGEKPPRKVPQKKRYPIALMKAGDSIFVPAASTRSRHLQISLAAMGKYFQGKYGGRFVTRTSDDGVRLHCLEAPNVPAAMIAESYEYAIEHGVPISPAKSGTADMRAGNL